MSNQQSRTLEKPKTYSVHKVVNWVVSLVLVCFAVWSIVLNAEGRGLYKQSVQTLEAIDKKLEDTQQVLKDTQSACQTPTPIVIPTPTTDTTNTH